MYNYEQKNNCEPDPAACEQGCKKGGCEQIENRFINVGVPIDLRPEVKVGRIKAECVGEPETRCKCNPDNSECELRIVQRLCVRIPVCFDIETDVGKALLECDGKDCPCKQ